MCRACLVVAIAAVASLAACTQPAPAPPPPEPMAALPPPPPTVISDQPVANPPPYRHHHHGRWHYGYTRGQVHPVHHTAYRRHVTHHNSGAAEPPGSVPASSPPNSPLPK